MEKSAMRLIDGELEIISMNIREYDEQIESLSRQLSERQSRKAAAERYREALEADRETLRLALVAKDHAIRLPSPGMAFRL